MSGSKAGMGGAYNSVNLNLYHYAGNNPITYTDPDGRIIDTIWDIGFTLFDIGSAIYKSTKGDHTGWVDVGIDAASILIPCVPAGLSKVDDAVKLVRKADKIGDAAKAADKITDASKIADKLSDAAKVMDNTTDVSKEINAVKKAENVADKLIDGSKMKTDYILSVAEEFLGPGYTEPVKNSGRFVSQDGKRVFRMGENDIIGRHGGGPHVNFERLEPNPAKPGKMMVVEDIHIYIAD